MVLAARDELGISLSRSMHVGDKLIDIAGLRAGVGLNVLVTGCERTRSKAKAVAHLRAVIPLLG